MSPLEELINSCGEFLPSKRLLDVESAQQDLA